MNQTALLILIAAVVVVLIIWMLVKRSKPAGQHVDTSATAVGAAVETMRNVVEETAEAVESALGQDVATDEAAPVQTARSEPVVKAEPVAKAAPAPKPKAVPKADPAPKADPVPASKAKATPKAEPAARPAAKAAPAAKAKPASAALTAIGVPAAVGDPDNLRLIKGLGPKLNTTLADLGITRFDQIAAWSAADIAKVDEHLGNFKGRITRDNWVEQAGFLASGDTARFEAKFGKLDSPGNN